MDHATTRTGHDHPARLRPWHAAIGAALGAVVGAALWDGSTDDLAQLLVLLPSVYVVAAAFDRPWTTWVALVVLTATFAASPLTPLPPGVAIAGVALAMTVLGTARGHAHTGLVTQVVVGAVFVAAAAAALAIGGEVAALLLAAAWAGHAAWDLLHLRSRRVVPATYAAWCAALDVVVAVGLALTALG